jgi:hypothetical protein
MGTRQNDEFSVDLIWIKFMEIPWIFMDLNGISMGF